MPLSFDEIGDVFQQMWDESEDIGEAAMATREEIGRLVLVRYCDLAMMNAPRRHILLQLDRTIVRLGRYAAGKPIAMRRLTLEALGVLEGCIVGCAYLESFWDRLPQALGKTDARRSLINQAMVRLWDIADSVRQPMAAGDSVEIDVDFLDQMCHLATMCFRMALGDELYHRFRPKVDAANAHLATHVMSAAIATRAARQKDPGPSKDS